MLHLAVEKIWINKNHTQIVAMLFAEKKNKS